MVPVPERSLPTEPGMMALLGFPLDLCKIYNEQIIADSTKYSYYTQLST